MNSLKLFNSLCTPAQLYLGMSVLAVLTQCYQNVGNPNVFACGLMKASTPINNIFYIAFEVLYVLGWTYLLNILCKKGYNQLSWLLVLLPFIAMFILIGLVIVTLQNN
jgi:mannose/fructose/N-acetylgalactosamine-specific phosphotransferase system component IID|tara:strand:- start:1277 stop:1600 length:324 start_codon:yes stop_codon:yes gene_type:complete